LLGPTIGSSAFFDFLGAIFTIRTEKYEWTMFRISHVTKEENARIIRLFTFIIIALPLIGAVKSI